MIECEHHALMAAVATAWPVETWRDAHVVLGVSGGPDSVALLRAAATAKAVGGGRGKLYVGHLHHGLRGEEADADEAWLGALCGRLDVPLIVGRADVAALATEAGDGWEAAARDARYKFLRTTADQLGARIVAVAHTAEDQVETVLHRVVRGTGLAGLSGMPFARPLAPGVSLVRPLLNQWRRDVLQYLADIGQDFRTDRSNEDARFTRNRLRNEVLPMLRSQFNRDVDLAILRLAKQAGEAQGWIANQAAALVAKCVFLEGAVERVRIDCRPLSDEPPLVVREVCRQAWKRANWPQQAMTYTIWQQLAAFVQEGAGSSLNLPGDVRCFRNEEAVLLERRASAS